MTLYVCRKVHEGAVFAICALRDGGYLTGGGKDHRIVQLDADLNPSGDAVTIDATYGGIRAIMEGRNEQIFVGTTRNCILNGQAQSELSPIIDGHTDELWGLDVHPESDRFITGAFDHVLKLWNAETHSLEWSEDLKEPIQSCAFSRSGNEIVVGLTSGKWVVLKADSKEKVFERTDGHEPIQTIAFSPDGNLLAIGSRDNFIYVYQVSENNTQYERVGKCSVGSQKKTASCIQ